MKKLKYSPTAKEKIKTIKMDIKRKFGSDVANAVINRMTSSFRNLQRFENLGSSVESVIGVPCEYRFIYVQHNYAFYKVENDTIWITNIYNEKEDFMWKLFEIKEINSSVCNKDEI